MNAPTSPRYRAALRAAIHRAERAAANQQRRRTDRAPRPVSPADALGFCLVLLGALVLTLLSIKAGWLP